MIEVGIMKRNAKTVVETDECRHEADQEVTIADKANKAAKPPQSLLKSTKLTKPLCHFAWLVVDRLDCSEYSCGETAPGRLQGNYLMQHDETTASPNDLQRESFGKTDKSLAAAAALRQSSFAAIQCAPLLNTACQHRLRPVVRSTSPLSKLPRP